MTTDSVDRAAAEHYARLRGHDLSLEDRALLARWLSGPGARPTPDEVARWLRDTREGCIPRREIAADLADAAEKQHRRTTANEEDQK